jgi:hypothetical protein
VSKAWFEASIAPLPGQPEALLCDVVDPLIHDMLSEVEAWFFFWEDAEERGSGEDLRLRILGPAGNRARASAFLDSARHAGWYEGSHGRRGEHYDGEADFYGPEAWDLTCRDWTAMSELALSLVKLDAADSLTKPRSFHLSRQMHLYANQLRLDDVTTCLTQAQRYLELSGARNKESRRVLSAIGRYLKRREGA